MLWVTRPCFLTPTKTNFELTNMMPLLLAYVFQKWFSFSNRILYVYVLFICFCLTQRNGSTGFNQEKMYTLGNARMYMKYMLERTQKLCLGMFLTDELININMKIHSIIFPRTKKSKDIMTAFVICIICNLDL